MTNDCSGQCVTSIVRRTTGDFVMWRQYATLSGLLVPRRFFCWKFVRLQIHVWWTVMHLWFAHFRASFMDMQKPERRVQQQCRVRDFSHDAGLSIDGLLAVQILVCVSSTLTNTNAGGHTIHHMSEQPGIFHVDHVPANILESFRSTKLSSSEDNATVIQMVHKGRSTNLRRISRTHRINLEW